LQGRLHDAAGPRERPLSATRPVSRAFALGYRLARMHSCNELRSASFEIEVEGRSASFEDLFGGFEERDRVGVIVGDPLGAVGASTLLLAAVTRFYDFQRAKGGGFFIYPDYFVFHVGGQLGDHSMLDVWPSHKEVVVDDGPEQLLRAINDRAITRLVVQDGEPGQVEFDRETLASARSRIVSAVAYSPAGRVTGADVRIAGNDVTESYVNAVINPDDIVEVLGEAASQHPDEVSELGGDVSGELRGRVRARRRGLQEDGRPVETYRRVTLDEGLALLGASGSRHV
jgi:hypothetical protein